MDKYQAQMQARVANRRAQIAQDAATLPVEEDAILLFAKNSFTELHEAISRGDTARAQSARRRLDALAYNLAARDHDGSYRAARRIEASLAPPAGDIPTWGLDGEFLAVVDGIKVRCVKLGAHLSLHAVDADAPFFTPTGFRSCLNGFGGGGDVMAATVSVIRRLLNENGRQSIEPQYRDHIKASQPEWVAIAVAALGAPQLSYQDGVQMAFAF